TFERFLSISFLQSVMAESSDLLNYINKLYILDETISKLVIKRNWVDSSSYLRKFLHIVVSGSIVEGGAICRSLVCHHPQIEIDLMNIRGEISQEDAFLILDDVKSWTGFYRLRKTRELESSLNFHSFYWDDPKEKYFNVRGRQKIKRHLVRPSWGSTHTIEGPSNASSYFHGEMEFQRDKVEAIGLKYWPLFTRDWFSKPRYWPSFQVMLEVLENGCHLVQKTPPGPCCEEWVVTFSPEDNCQIVKKLLPSIEHNEWRISFSVAEKILSREKSPFQKKCFLLGKCLYYEFMKVEIDEKTKRTLPSYLIKTVMLQMLEETPEFQWNSYEKGNAFLQVVTELYKRLQRWL
ncbi:MAG: hypothetical protein AAFY76_19450, partial [Cyanobacteria bacterium J06649_11]